ncbi:hypothetical protein STEG23_000357 [Scotinomys teguina]
MVAGALPTFTLGGKDADDSCRMYLPVITGSKNLQNVNITLRILFRLVAIQLPHIYTSVGENYDERVQPSITTEILKKYPQVRIIHYMDDILLAAPSQVMLDKAYAHTVQALEKKGLYIAPEKVQKDSIDNHYPKNNLLLFITHHPIIFPKVTAMEPLKGAIEIYTDGSKSGVGVYLVQGQEPVQFRFQPNIPQTVECQILYEVFKRFHEPFNLLSDSYYVVNAVRGLETSAFIKESSPVHDILWNICVLIRERTAPFFIRHIRAHTLLPGPMTAANDLVDKATRAFAAVELDSISMAKQFHQLYHVPAHTLCLKFKISRQSARDIVKACSSCVQFLHPPHVGINPRGLRPGDLWQMDVTHIPSFGKLSYVHVSMDTCSAVIFASPLTGEKDQENPIWIPERLTRFIRHEDPDPDTSDKPDSSSDQSRTRDAVVGSDQDVADPDASAC